MHELAIAGNLVQQLVEIGARENLENISLVSIKVGVLRQVIKETLEEAFKIQSMGTPAEETELEIVNVPLRLRCSACGAEEDGRDFISACSSCGSREFKIVSGKELYIDYVKGEK